MGILRQKFQTLNGRLCIGIRTTNMVSGGSIIDTGRASSIRARLARIRLGSGHIAGRESFWSLNHGKLNTLAFVKGFVAVGLYRRIVDEDVFAAIAHYESVPFCSIKPFHRADLSQCLSLLRFADYLVWFCVVRIGVSREHLRSKFGTRYFPLLLLPLLANQNSLILHGDEITVNRSIASF